MNRHLLIGDVSAGTGASSGEEAPGDNPVGHNQRRPEDAIGGAGGLWAMPYAAHPAILGLIVIVALLASWFPRSTLCNPP